MIHLSTAAPDGSLGFLHKGFTRLYQHIGFTHGYGGWHLHFAHGGFLISLPLSFLLLLVFYFLKIVSFASPHAQKDARDEVRNPTEEVGDHPKEDEEGNGTAIITFVFWVIRITLFRVTS